MNINRRLEAMRERLEHFRPCTMTFTMKNGEIIKANPAAVWDIFRIRAREAGVAAKAEAWGITPDDVREMALTYAK